MTAGEGLFAAALTLSWASSALHVALGDRPLYGMAPAAMTGPVRAWRAVALLGASVVFAGALWAWTSSGWPRLGALAVLGCLAALRQWETRQWAGDTVIRLGKYVPAAACLLGWVVAASATWALGWTEGASLAAAWEGAAGVMAALYTLAGLSKVTETGWRWVTPSHHALLVAERAFTGPRPIRALRRRAARSRVVCGAVGVVGLVAELACALYVFPDARPALTVAVLALHAGIVLLLGYVEPEWWLVMIAITAVTTVG